jgi:hypothetical protein
MIAVPVIALVVEKMAKTVSEMKAECDGILRRVTTVKDRVPGVVAMITDRSANIYEGAMGEATSLPEQEH